MLDHDLQAGVGPQDERTREQGVGDQRHEQQGLDLRPDHGPAAGIGVGRRTGGRGHHQAVAAEGGDRLPVDPDGDLQHAGAVALLQGRLVEGPVVGDAAIGGGDLDIHGHASLHRIVAGHQVGHDLLDRVGIGLRQEADVTRVDADQGHIALPCDLRGAQDRAVAAQDEDEVDVTAEGRIDGLNTVGAQRRLGPHDCGGGRRGLAVARNRGVTAVPLEHHDTTQSALGSGGTRGTRLQDRLDRLGRAGGTGRSARRPG